MEHNEEQDYIQHYGVKGMKWGVRNGASKRLIRSTNKLNSAYKKGIKGTDKRALKKIASAEGRRSYLDTKDKKWLTKVGDDANVAKVAKRTARDMKKVAKELKVEYGGRFSRAVNPRKQAQFQNELQAAYEEILAANTYSVYKMSPTHTKQVVLTNMGDGTMKAVVESRNTAKLNKQMISITKAANKHNITHSDADLDIVNGMFFLLDLDDDGFPEDVYDYTQMQEESIEQSDYKSKWIQINDEEELLIHYGVPGMRWGVKKAASFFSGRREAKEIAKEDRRAALKIANRGKTWKKRSASLDELSTNDLKRSLNRLKLENQFNDEVKRWPAAPSKQQSKAKEFIKGQLKAVLSSDPVKNAAINALKSAMGSNEAESKPNVQEAAQKTKAKSGSKAMTGEIITPKRKSNDSNSGKSGIRKEIFDMYESPNPSGRKLLN